MKKLFPALVVTLLLVTAAVSQTARPTQTPPDDDVVKISTNLIQVDVSVTDSKGKPVTDLRPEDFEVYENGELQNVSAFSYISSVREVPRPAATPSDRIDIPVPPAVLRPDSIRRTIALVVDDLTLSFRSAYDVRAALRKYVDEQMREGDLVAIIRTGSGIGALQQFTSDKRLLYAAIERLKWNPLGRGRIGAFAPIRDNEQLEPEGETDEITAPAGDSLENFRETVFATGTLGALRFVVQGISELPGRKSVVLFSDGFSMCETDSQAFRDCGRVLDYLRQVIDQANRASVVFYTIDARGLQYTGLTAEDSVRGDASRIRQVQAQRDQELWDTQQGLAFLAEETGGLAVRNSNDLSRGVQRVLDDQSYYLIGYEPDTDTFDPAKRRFNRLEIKVRREGVNVRYRSGFFNVATEDRPKPVLTSSPVAQIQNALVSPFAVNDISLRLNTLFGYDEKTGPYIRSLLHVSADKLKFVDEPDGAKRAVFEILAASFGDNGAIVDQLAKSYTMRVRGDAYETIVRNGFVYHFAFPIKRPGAYQLRIAIRDSQDPKVGSASQFVEVPDLKKKRLTLSGIVLENLTVADWKQLQVDLPSEGAIVGRRDPLTDTSLRRFRRNSVLRYGLEIYNARLDQARRPNLATRIRVYADGKLVLDGKQQPVDFTGQKDPNRIRTAGAISLASQLLPGDYILQLVVFDNNAKEKRRISTQYVQFEVIE